MHGQWEQNLSRIYIRFKKRAMLFSQTCMNSIFLTPEMLNRPQNQGFKMLILPKTERMNKAIVRKKETNKKNAPLIPPFGLSQLLIQC
jgi:hypothetical protein